MNRYQGTALAVHFTGLRFENDTSHYASQLWPPGRCETCQIEDSVSLCEGKNTSMVRSKHLLRVRGHGFMLL